MYIVVSSAVIVTRIKILLQNHYCHKDLVFSYSFVENPLAFLLRNPNFVQLRNEVARNPAMLPLILQSIGTENPELLQVS